MWFTSCTVVGFWLTRKRTCRRDKNDHRRLGLRAQGWDLRRGRSEVSPSECRTSSGVHALHHSRRYMHNSAMLGPCDGTILGLLPCFWCRFFFAVFHTILRYSIQHINTEVRSHQDQRQEAKGENSARDKLCPGCWLGSVDAFDDVYYKLPRSFIDVGRSVYDGYTLSLKLQQLPEADGVAMLRFLRVLNPRNLVAGNVVSFHKHRAVVCSCTLSLSITSPPSSLAHRVRVI